MDAVLRLFRLAGLVGLYVFSVLPVLLLAFLNQTFSPLAWWAAALETLALVGMFALMARLCLTFYRNDRSARIFRDWRSPWQRRSLIAALLLYLLIPAYSLLLSALLSQAGVETANPDNQRIIEEILENLPFTAAAVWLVLAAPVLEELLLRGLFFNCFGSLRSRAKRLAVAAASAAVFALLHEQHSPLALFQYFVMGSVFCAAYLCTRDLKYPILVHMANNAVSLALVYAA